MQIAQIEIENFRGIRTMAPWKPNPGVNCLIGAGDSMKTTILDAIELCLNQRQYSLADDTDFYNLDINTPIRIIVTLIDIPAEFKSEDKYGLYLRGWNREKAALEDEPATGLEEALSVMVRIDNSFEPRWSIINDRIAAEKADPPSLRYADAKRLSTTRIGPYADRHLRWGRNSLLQQLSEGTGRFSTQLAAARSAARDAFRNSDLSSFKETEQKVEDLSKLFSVPVRKEYKAELDLDSGVISAGVIALHDDKIPLRKLGTGSSRLLAAALQHDAGYPAISLIDEVEYGLEPHRIARLLRYVKSPKDAPASKTPQVFLTTHSPVVILELTAGELFAIRPKNGAVTIYSVEGRAKDSLTAQRHIRSIPEAFLARRIVVGEGRTEQGLVRGLDRWWTENGFDSFALQGTVVVDGGGKDKAPLMCEHLLDIECPVFFLHDTDKLPNTELLSQVQQKGGKIVGWPASCSTEQRIFFDVPWDAVRALLKYAAECKGSDSVLANIQKACQLEGQAAISSIDLDTIGESAGLRKILGSAAKQGEWFKDITRGEFVGRAIGPYLQEISSLPLAKSLNNMREWVDAEH